MSSFVTRGSNLSKIWTLPKLTLAFSTSGLSTLQNVLGDSHDPPALSLPQEVPRKPQELDVEQLLIAPIGETSPKPYLCVSFFVYSISEFLASFLQVFLRSGQLNIYQIVPAGQPIEPLEKIRPSHLNIQFVKIVSMAFEIQRQDDSNEKSIIAEQKRISRGFIPFVTSPSPGITYSGVFFTGDRPNWILASNKSGVQIYPSGHSVVHAFTACSLWESRGDFLLYTEEVRRHVIIP
jgi:cleavage and polyadenylation specificity factor subunit 1